MLTLAMSEGVVSEGAMNTNDSAAEPDPARSTKVKAQSGQLPMAVFGLGGDRATEVTARNIPGEDQNPILVLDHHTHSGPEPDTFKS